jgi:hypothetical protein
VISHRLPSAFAAISQKIFVQQFRSDSAMTAQWLHRDFALISQRFRGDWASIPRRLHSDSKAIAQCFRIDHIVILQLFLQRLVSDFTTILERFHSAFAAFVQRLIGDSTVTAQSLRSDCAVILQQPWSDFTVASPFFHSDCASIQKRSQCLAANRLVFTSFSTLSHHHLQLPSKLQNLSSESKKYKWGAKQLSFMALVKQWAPLIAIIAIAFVILLLRFLL